MKSILFLSSELPYPPFSGGRIKSWNLVKFLSQHYNLTVGCILKGDDENFKDEFLAKADLQEFFAEALAVDRSALNLIHSYIKGIPLNLFRTYSRKFEESVNKKASEFDMIFVDHYEVCQYVPDDYKGFVVLHTHNAEYIMWERYAAEGGSPVRRVVAFLESRRIRHHESLACNRADLVFAAPNDIENLVKIGAYREKCQITYHLGDDSQLDLPSLKFEDTQKALLYVGTLTWEANVDGLLWFFKDVWPLLKQEHPDLKLWIAGKNPDKRLIHAAENEPQIIFKGFVEELEPYLKKSRVYIAPLRFGSGIKVKVLNAMSRGIPTVTTSVGTEGLAAESMKQIAITDTPEEFKKAVSLLLNDQKIWEGMEASSRILVREKYTWKALFRDMKTHLDSGLEADL
ncbi:glycosyltransferase [Desulfobacterales bacterium HSG17]|nr:glycosyltransferase [Desulfobacterales bacterium HSG17]